MWKATSECTLQAVGNARTYPHCMFTVMYYTYYVKLATQLECFCPVFALHCLVISICKNTIPNSLNLLCIFAIVIPPCAHRPKCVLMARRSLQALFDFPWLWCRSHVQRVSIECGRAGEREQVFVCLFMYEWVTLTDSLCARQLLWHDDRMRSPTAHPRHTYYVRRSSARTHAHTLTVSPNKSAWITVKSLAAEHCPALTT